MIDYKLHKNGWTVMIENLDLRKAQQQDIGRYLQTDCKVHLRSNSKSITRNR